MAIVPRLDLRQTQPFVMTPQLRQAIKLLQYSNVEVASFVEEELERNPLLERGEADDTPPPERAALDQIVPVNAAPTDTAAAATAETLPAEAAAPLDADNGNIFDTGGVADGAGMSSRIDGRG